MNELPQPDREFLSAFLPSAAKSALSPPDRERRDRPFVTLTYASSLDSMIALAPGARTTLSGPETKCMTHFLRLQHDAILVGVGTAVVDNPALNCRYPGATLHDQPQPIILDPNGRWNPQDRKVVQLASDHKGRAPWVFTTKRRAQADPWDEIGGEYIVLDSLDQDATGVGDALPLNRPSMPWPAILKTLKEKGVQSVMIEGGATVINTLLSMPESVDSVIITVAPTWLGQGGVQVAPAARATDGQRANSAWLRKCSWRQFGNDVVLCGRLHES